MFIQIITREDLAGQDQAQVLMIEERREDSLEEEALAKAATETEAETKERKIGSKEIEIVERRRRRNTRSTENHLLTQDRDGLLCLI